MSRTLLLAVTLTCLVGSTNEADVSPRDLLSASLESTNLAVAAATPTKDYAEAIRLSLMFYYAQRSGKLPANNPIPWRKDSALNDCVVGGWYDAGDHVKFGFPMAGALTILLWGAERFKDGYGAAGQLDAMYDTAKWGLDYLVNSWNPFTQELVIQVGDGDVDHQFWGRPEEMTMQRPCGKIGPGKPGSDVAGESAAALAAGSLVFKEKGDFAYASQLLQTAESIYAFAKANRGRFSDNPTGVLNQWYYGSNDDKDEMCEAGVWLYKATGEHQYLTDAEHEHEATLPDEYSWNDKRAACQLLLFEETQGDDYRAEVKAFLSSWKPGGTKIYSPCGIAWGNATYWGSARHVSNVAFAALVAAEDGINAGNNRQWAAEQINYLLGDNPHDGGCFSYEIGYGNKYPLQPHHRAASCPDLPAPCSQSNLDANTPSPQVLYGGLVGGPIYNDGYNDTRQDYVHNEVALDYNSGFQSALAERQKQARDVRLGRVLLSSMRSMDSSKHPDFNCGPTTGRRARPRSPVYDHYDTHTRQRQRQSDANTEEIIQFVRGYQLERETTFLRLQKKAVLPGIGQMSCSMDDPGLSSRHLGRHDSRADDGDEDDDDDDEDEDEGLADEDVLVDSEVAAIDAAHRDPLRHTSLGHDPRYGGREGHRFDRCPKPSASYGPPVSNHRQAFRPLDNHGHAGGRAHAGRSLGRSLNQLPPIARDELPDRPSAPSPSLTPPGEDEELDSAGEPIDFIDAS